MLGSITKVTFLRQIHSTSLKFKVHPSNLKGKSKSSQDWIIRQLKDPYVKKAREQDYRARSAFKLIEIDEKFKLLKNGMNVVECGSAPGAWSQIVIQRINSDGNNDKSPKGMLVGVDLLPIAPLKGAIFLPFSDFTDSSVQAKIQEYFGSTVSENDQRDGFVDIILSDMAPNASGILELDQAKICTLVRSCLVYAIKFGKEKSHLVAKIWNGSDLNQLEELLKKYYKDVRRFKPKSSRDDSAELYLIARGKVKVNLN